MLNICDSCYRYKFVAIYNLNAVRIQISVSSVCSEEIWSREREKCVASGGEVSRSFNVTAFKMYVF
jgi:hypothetical protein